MLDIEGHLTNCDTSYKTKQTEHHSQAQRVHLTSP